MKLLLYQKHPFLTRDRQHSYVFRGKELGVRGQKGPLEESWRMRKKLWLTSTRLQEFKAGINVLKAVWKHSRKHTCLTWFNITFLRSP